MEVAYWICIRHMFILPILALLLFGVHFWDKTYRRTLKYDPGTRAYLKCCIFYDNPDRFPCNNDDNKQGNPGTHTPNNDDNASRGAARRCKSPLQPKTCS
jgi:hypothetical protein